MNYPEISCWGMSCTLFFFFFCIDAIVWEGETKKKKKKGQLNSLLFRLRPSVQKAAAPQLPKPSQNQEHRGVSLLSHTLLSGNTSKGTHPPYFKSACGLFSSLLSNTYLLKPSARPQSAEKRPITTWTPPHNTQAQGHPDRFQHNTSNRPLNLTSIYFQEPRSPSPGPRPRVRGSPGVSEREDVFNFSHVNQEQDAF